MSSNTADLNLVQHADINATPSHYKHLEDNELLLTSIFYTIQGEGPWGGYASTFVRTAGCSLGRKENSCRFCDTFFKYSEGKVRTFDSILDEVKEKSKGRSNLIVITGGEPMLQKNIIEFVKYVNSQGFETQFETNGLLYRDIPKTGIGPADSEDPIAFSTMKNTIVCSPKMGASDKYPELRGDVFDRADCLKFVVEKEGKFNYLPDYAFRFKKTGRPVYVSPINVYNRAVERGETPCIFTPGLYNIEVCRENYRYAGELCLEHGFILNIQKHLLLGVD